MLSIITRGMVFGPEIKCEDVTPCVFVETTVTNPEDTGPIIIVDQNTQSTNHLENDFNS